MIDSFLKFDTGQIYGYIWLEFIYILEMDLGFEFVCSNFEFD